MVCNIAPDYTSLLLAHTSSVNLKAALLSSHTDRYKIRAAVSATPTLKAGDKYINEKGETVTVSAYGGYVTRKPSKY